MGEGGVKAQEGRDIRIFVADSHTVVWQPTQCLKELLPPIKN